jgi:putative heme-binding domain-containing protein
VRHARRVLQERAAAGHVMTTAHAELRTILNEHPDVTRQLRALWTLHATGGLERQKLEGLLEHADENVRGWAIQLLAEDRTPSDPALKRFAAMAGADRSALVRLYLASALQRLEAGGRWNIAAGLLAHAEDEKDQNLPLMIWYGIEPLVGSDPDRFASLAAAARIPLVRRHIARRASEPDVRATGVAAIVKQLARAMQDEVRSDLLTGTLEGLKGVRSVTMPAGWAELAPRLRASDNRVVSSRALELSLVFDDPAALAELYRQAADGASAPDARLRALDALAARHPKDFAPLLLKLTADPVTRQRAVRALAEYEHADTPATLLGIFPAADAATRQDVIQTLASRSAWAAELLDAVERRVVPRTDLTAFTARQIDQLRDESLSARVKSLWGEIRPTDAEKSSQIERWKRTLTPAVVAMGNVAKGLQLYQRLCAACHQLFDEGTALGPDLTGSQRTNVGYLLENIIDPSAGVPRDYQVNTFITTSGRTVSGFVISEDAVAVTVALLNERVTIPTSEIKDRQLSPQSMMPEGLLQGLKAAEVRDLIAFLGSSGPGEK